MKNKNFAKKIISGFFVFSVAINSLFFNKVLAQEDNVYKLSSDKITYSVFFDADGFLKSDKIVLSDDWAKQYNNNSFALKSDADFRIDIFWTSWSAPGKYNNAENDVVLTKKDFRLKNVVKNSDNEILFVFAPVNTHFILKIYYELPREAYYIRRKIELIDTIYTKHFLQNFYPFNINIDKKYVGTVIKNGGFGQPVAFETGSGGAFYGIEYPAAYQLVNTKQNSVSISEKQEIGTRITSEGVSSDWAVVGLTPDKNIKWWFYNYIDNIRIAPLRPYTLYNSWYDLRSPAFQKIPQENIMNEKNIMRIIDLIKQNMIDKYGIKLDAFVLDDGWDIYESDWKLNPETFPNGVKPIADRLKKYDTDLGIWFGPTGGYSFRDKRINWMREHGYEVCGEPVGWHTAMLCLAGKNYSDLFRKRTVDFVKQGVAFFKWDGIQFSCSDPSHGHPVGVYSRRAVMQSLIDKCNAVRNVNPNTYLNITSGTWLSPWWVKYANQIWMQGYDYGYADAPSISKRDAAMTYRDYVLYDDFINHGFWFPIANLMTHGIIKGNLQKLGGEKEPIDKFTNNALLYFARGVSMYELYISPDILTPQEWHAIATSLKWAKSRFDILKNTFFAGGNPAKRQPYAYVHFSNDRGIIAARNPFISNKKISVSLDKKYGFYAANKKMVVEQVYPYHQVFNKLFEQGDKLTLDLDGYETAVFEIYPFDEAKYPLITGAKFRVINKNTNFLTVSLYDFQDKIQILNKEVIAKIYDENNKKIKIENIEHKQQKTKIISSFSKDNNKISINFQTEADIKNAYMAVLFENERDTVLPDFQIHINKKKVKSKETKEKKKWLWKTYDLTAKNFNADIYLPENATGKLSVYVIFDLKTDVQTVKFKLKKTANIPPMPPQIYDIGYVNTIYKIGETIVN